MDMKADAARIYRQSARAEAAAATGRLILDAFAATLRERWFEEVTLEEVAERAGVNVRTVIRRYGGKEGLLDAFVDDFRASIDERRDTPAGDVASALERLLAVYEEWGDGVIRNLAQEPRHPALKRLLDDGRRRHREQTAQIYAPWLDRLAEPARRAALDALVTATDVYVWKLARRDMGRTREETTDLMRGLVEAVLAQLSPKRGTS